MELTLDQQAAILAVAEKEIKELSKCTRERFNCLILAANEADGTKTREIKLGGMPIATASVAQKKGGWIVADEDAWSEFAIENGMASCEAYIDPAMLSKVEDVLDAAGLGNALIYRYKPVEGWEKRLADISAKPILKDTGEIVPGMAWMDGSKYTVIKPKVRMADIERTVLALGETRPVLELVGGQNDYR